MNTAERGFSLIEMLVALFIFALLSTASVAALAMTLDAKENLGEASDYLGEFAIARSLLRSDVGQLSRRGVKDVYGTPQNASFWGGDADEDGTFLRFSRRGWQNYSAAPRASLQYVEYAWVGTRIVRRSRSYLDPTPDTPIFEQTILSGVRDVRVSFFVNGLWQTSWAAAPRAVPGGGLPKVVAIEIETTRFGVVRQLFPTSSAM